MTVPAKDDPWLREQAARISALAAQANEATRKGLEHYRDIGRELHKVRNRLMDGKGTQGAFGKWCEENTSFDYSWRSRVMKLAAEWDAIERKLAPGQLFPTNVKECLALLRPPTGPRITEDEANRLRGLASHAAGTGPEADIARRHLAKIASERGLTIEALSNAAVLKAARLDDRKSFDKKELEWALGELRRLRLLLDKHGIQY